MVSQEPNQKHKIFGDLYQLCFILIEGNLTEETVIAQIGCSGKTIVEFTTSSPIGLIKSAIMNPSTGYIHFKYSSFNF